MKQINNYSHRVLNFINNHLLVITVMIAAISAFVVFLWSYQHGYIYSYGDAKSHLNISRRLIDSLTPGFAQLGSSWLPLYHLMMLPLIWNDFFYHTGIAGTYINYILYIGSVVLLFKSILLITKQRFAATFGSLLFALNVNVLYLQAAAMSEISTVFFIILSIYLFIRWQKEKELYLLILLAFSCFMGTLDRYEMWAITLALVPAIILSSFKSKEANKTDKKILEGNLIIFCTLAFFGIFLWLLWNFIIFADPLNFVNGIYSAKAYQTVIISLHYNVFYHNILKSFLYYFVDSADVNTWSITILGVIGSIYYLAKVRSIKALALVGVCVSIFIFEAYSIYSGNSTIYVPQLYPYDYYNVRYGIYALPFLILFVGFFLGMKRKILPIIFTLILFAETAFNYQVMPITLFDSSFSKGPVLKDKPKSAQAQKEAAIYIRDHYRGGLILTSAGVNDGIIFLSGIDMKNFITEGNGKYWTESLKEPSKYATWIILRYDYVQDVRNTLINVVTTNNKLGNYKLIFVNSEIKIYKIIHRQNKFQTITPSATSSVTQAVTPSQMPAKAASSSAASQQ